LPQFGPVHFWEHQRFVQRHFGPFHATPSDDPPVAAPCAPWNLHGPPGYR
jgi:hypothetical protein